MNWLPKDEFWYGFETNQFLEKIDFIGWCCFEISESSLREKIGGVEPNQDISGEGDLPGPASRWYGDLDGTPLILDFHHEHPGGDVVTIHHGDNPKSRTKIREEFSKWGSKWDESPAS